MAKMTKRLLNRAKPSDNLVNWVALSVLLPNLSCSRFAIVLQTHAASASIYVQLPTVICLLIVNNILNLPPALGVTDYIVWSLSHLFCVL